MPATRYWPERSIAQSLSISEKRVEQWQADKPRPTELLGSPAPVEVMALIPDHPRGSLSTRAKGT